MDTIEHSNWTLTRTIKDEIYIYEFYHKPIKDIMPFGRYCKYIQEDGKVIIIEEGPYLGQV